MLSENRSDNANDDRLTAPMQGSPKKRSACTNADWLRATARNEELGIILLGRRIEPVGTTMTRVSVVRNPVVTSTSADEQ